MLSWLCSTLFQKNYESVIHQYKKKLGKWLTAQHVLALHFPPFLPSSPPSRGCAGDEEAAEDDGGQEHDVYAAELGPGGGRSCDWHVSVLSHDCHVTVM